MFSKAWFPQFHKAQCSTCTVLLNKIHSMQILKIHEITSEITQYLSRRISFLVPHFTQRVSRGASTCLY